MAFPVLGAGNGRLPHDLALRTMLDEIAANSTDVACRIVRYRHHAPEELRSQPLTR